MGLEIKGKPLIKGAISGKVLASREPLSFWGGYNCKTGKIIDQRHPLAGYSAIGKILALPFTRGSSSTTAVLLEALRMGTAPAAIISTEADPFFALTSIVADEMYGKTLPLVQLPTVDFEVLMTADSASIREDGKIQIK